MKKLLLTITILLSLVVNSAFGQRNDTTFYVSEIVNKSLYIYLPEISNDSVRYIGTVVAKDDENDPLKFYILDKPFPTPYPSPNPTPWPTVTKYIFLIHKSSGDFYVEKKNCGYLFSIKKHQFVAAVTDCIPGNPTQFGIMTVITTK